MPVKQDGGIQVSGDAESAVDFCGIMDEFSGEAVTGLGGTVNQNRRLNAIKCSLDVFDVHLLLRQLDAHLRMAHQGKGQVANADVGFDAFMLEAEQKQSIIMQVHDELVLEVPDAELELMKQELPRLMAQVAQLRVPLLAEVGVGKNWEHAH